MEFLLGIAIGIALVFVAIPIIIYHEMTKGK